MIRKRKNRKSDGGGYSNGPQHPTDWVFGQNILATKSVRATVVAVNSDATATSAANNYRLLFGSLRRRAADFRPYMKGPPAKG